MALRLRRGTDAERQLITPVQGELIYTTDTKKLYIGDDVTVGGQILEGAGIADVLSDITPQLGGNLDLNNFDITGTGDINIVGSVTATQFSGGFIAGDNIDLNGNNIIGTGNIAIDGTITATGNINLGDGVGNDRVTISGQINSNLIPVVGINAGVGSFDRRWEEGYFVRLNLSGGILGQDSTVVFDANTGTFTGNFLGDVQGTVFGNVFGNTIGDLQGSVFGDDSTLLVDSVNNIVTADNLITNTITSLIGSNITLRTASTVSPRMLLEIASIDEAGTHAITRESESDISGTNLVYGRIVFTRNDLNGSFTTSLISGARDYIGLFNDPAGNANDPSKYLLLTNGKVSIGAGNTPSATLEVAGSIKPGVYVDAAARDTAIPSPTAGEMVFVTDIAKFQGYDGSAWANLN